MKQIALLGISVCGLVGIGYGAQVDYRGKLIDASCKCAPTSSTSSFAVDADGKVRMFDAEGNGKAATAMKDGLVKQDNDGDYKVIVSGSVHHKMLKVESIRAHKSDTSVH